MKNLIAAALVLATASAAMADIQAPPRPGPTRKFARGIANVMFAPVYVVDSWYTSLQTEGPTVAATFGIIEGTDRMLNSIGLGVAEIVTFPAPPYTPIISTYDMPPADLRNFY